MTLRDNNAGVVHHAPSLTMRHHALAFLCGVACLVGACLANVAPANMATPATPADTPPAPAILENVAPPPDLREWQDVRTGLQVRTVLPEDNPLFQMITVRLDPAYYRFRAHYRPDDPLTLEQWRALLPDAQVIMNANFFHPDYRLLGMFIEDGVTHGRSFTDRGGTFYVEGDTVGIRNNIRQPYMGEAWQQAVQAFPMLVMDGIASYNVVGATRPSRRSVIGIDGEGHVVLMATPNLGLGLYALSQYLPTAGLNLVSAFNLDGGGSTMLAIAPTGYEIRSRDPVPAILAVYLR